MNLEVSLASMVLVKALLTAVLYLVSGSLVSGYEASKLKNR